jgi:hypothetical protein
MKTNETALKEGAALAKKCARSAGKKAKKSTNNLKLKVQNRGGAPRGNTNALKHGRRSRAYLEARRLLRARLREMNALFKLGKALKMDAETEAMFLAALALHEKRLAQMPP